MKIAFISLYSTAPWGGCEDLWVETAKYASQNGHNVLASVFDFENRMSPRILELQSYGVKLHKRKIFIPKKSIVARGLDFIGKMISPNNADYRPLVDFNPDYILINDPGTFIYVRDFVNLQETIQNHNFRYSIVCKLTPDYGSAISKSLRQQARLIFAKADKMFFVSNNMKLSVERFLAQDLPNSSVIQNPVNLDGFETVEYQLSEKVKFASVAHLSTVQKGQQIILSILAQKLWQNRDWQITFYGSGPDKDYLVELSKYYGLENKVVFAGYVDSIEQVWKDNHILLHCSTSEGLPKAVIEAMVCGRTVVVSDVGGNAEVVVDNKTGFIAEAPSVNSFGAAMERAWKNKNRWKEFGREAREHTLKWIDKCPEKTLIDQLIS